MADLLVKTIGIWLILVILAILNAVIREKLLAPMIGTGNALPVSGLLLSILIFFVAYVSMPFLGFSESKTFIIVGVTWFALTLSFEFLFGHFVAGKPWQEILQVFNILKGNLFIVALLAALISPWLSAKIRGLL
jgi:hypothetical protein